MKLVHRCAVAVSVLALACTAVAAQPAAPARPAPSEAAAVADAASAPVSFSARKVYEQARTQLVQIRTVLKGRGSQTSVGSGFFVSAEGHIVTNFHVVSQAALKPDYHDLVYVTADGREAPLQILQLDVLHDLALLKAADAAGRSFDVLPFRPEARPLSQGERIYSLGNPLDVGFAVAEGTYNGVVRRGFYPQIFFGGALSAGMSGGPALDQEGRVVGINVARRVDGEQVSFLVPAAYAVKLLAGGRRCAADDRCLRRADDAADGAPECPRRPLHRTGLEDRDASTLPRAGPAGCVHALLGLERAVAHRRPRRRAVGLRDGHSHLRRRLLDRNDRAAPREL